MASAEPWSLTWLEFLGVRVGDQDGGHEEPWGIRRIQAAAADVGDQAPARLDLRSAP
jgi:hypothetical protein